jgi:TubC N-terminal docking domain
MLLAKLRASGLQVTADGDALLVEPRGTLTDQNRAMIRMHKHGILKDLAREREEHRRAIIAAREVAGLNDFHAALHLGRLQLCANCAGFTFASDPACLGHCARFGVEAWPFAPFRCSGYKVSATPAAPSFLPDPHVQLTMEREIARPGVPARLPFDVPIPAPALRARP